MRHPGLRSTGSSGIAHIHNLESTLMVDWVLRFFNHVINVYGTLGLYNFSINHPISCGQRTKSCAAVLHVLCFHPEVPATNFASCVHGVSLSNVLPCLDFFTCNFWGNAWHQIRLVLLFYFILFWSGYMHGYVADLIS